MYLFGKDLTREVAVVAEIGVNHEGSLSAALHLIGLAAEAGADAVKFQSYTPERYVSRSQAERFERISRFALNEDDHLRLKEKADECGVAFFSTPLTEDWVTFLSRNSSAIKIASGDMVFEPTVRAAARTGLPILLSTGLATMDEIERTVGWIKDESSLPVRDRLVILHCVAAYPPPAAELNLRVIASLHERFGCVPGYSNHSPELAVCVAAVALGARVVEVHFTDSRDGKEFHDHHLSAEPDELRRLIHEVSVVATALGGDEKNRQPSESGNLDAARKGIVAAMDLTAGTVLESDHLMFARPASEFEAARLDDVLGRPIAHSVRRGELIRRSDLS